MISNMGPAGKLAGPRPTLTMLGGLVDVSARRFPESAVALRYPQGDGWSQLTYQQLAAAAKQCALQFATLGVNRGDVLGLQMLNSFEFVVALLGAANRGAAMALLETGIPGEDRANMLKQVGARALIVSAEEDAPASNSLPNQPPVITVTFAAKQQTVATGISSGPPTLKMLPYSRPRMLPTDTALILYTSGTTGNPKAVPLNDNNVLASIQDIVSTLRLTESDVTLAAMPLFHGHGLFATLLATLASGGCLGLPHKGKFSATYFWSDMAAVGATWYTGTPTLHQILLSTADAQSVAPVAAKLRFVRSCSAALSPRVAQSLAELVHAPVIQAYGQTETSHQTASLYPGESACLHRSVVGHPTGVEMRLVDQAGCAVPHGTHGEVIVRGPTVMLGYVGESNAAHFYGEWYRTGDLGVFDDEGNLSLVGRIKEIINRGGEKVSPTQVDLALLADPRVSDACAFGIPDPLYGQKVAAAVVTKPGSSLTAQDLFDSVSSRLEKAAIPAELFFVASIPQTPKGTSDRKKVAQMFSAGELGKPQFPSSTGQEAKATS